MEKILVIYRKYTKEICEYKCNLMYSYKFIYTKYKLKYILSKTKLFDEGKLTDKSQRHDWG